MRKTNCEIGDSIFMACGKQDELEKITALARDKIAKDLDLIDENTIPYFAVCFFHDFSQCILRKEFSYRTFC